jgi:hypothetical protein
MKGYYKRLPLRQKEPRPLGWYATRDGEVITQSNYDTPKEAQIHAGKVAGCQLAWQRSEDPNQMGSYWYNATASDGRSYSVAMDYARDKEAIPNAMYVTDDDECDFYIVPDGDGWSVKRLQDWTGSSMSSSELALRTGMDIMDAHIARHLIQHHQIVSAETRELALQYGRYIWGAFLAMRSTPPPSGKWRSKVRKIALGLL